MNILKSCTQNSFRVRPGLVAAMALAALLAPEVGNLKAQSAPAASTSSFANQSMQFTESAKDYTVTMQIPEKDAPKVRVNLDGRKLRISSGKSASGARYEQTFYLPDADPLKNPQVSQKDGQLVVSVPKGKPGSADDDADDSSAGGAIQPRTGTASISRPGVDSMAAQMMAQVAQMQQQMNAMFSSTMQNQNAPAMNFPGHNFGGGMSMGTSVKIEDQGNSYLVRAEGVNNKSKVNISVDDGRLLKITSRDESSSNGQNSNSYQMSNFTQMVTLPGDVQAEKMSTKQDGNDLLITLPKA